MAKMKWDRAKKRAFAPRPVTVLKKAGGPPCPKCGAALEIREHAEITNKQLAKPYYFSRWFYCHNPRCKRKTHMVEEFKVYNRVAPRPKGLPSGWRYEDRSVWSPKGERVPLVDHPLVGTDKERAVRQDYERVIAECRAYDGPPPWEN